MMKPKLSKTAIRRRRIMTAVDAVLGTILCAGFLLGLMALFGWLAELAGRAF